MAITNTDLVQQLYVSYFNRPADPAGLAFWTAQLNAGASVSAISGAFSGSAEYKAAYAGLTNDQIVNKVYVNLFGHGADIGGLDYWSAKLSSGAVPIAAVVAAIASGAQTSDMTAFNDKVAAADAFTTAIDSNPAARLAYTGAAANAEAIRFLSTVTDDASLAAAIDPTALATEVTNITNVGTPTTPAQIFTLTTGIDTGATFVGGAGDDTYNAVGSATLNAFNSLDSIDGGAGNNTLNVVSTQATNLPAGSVSVKNIQAINLTSASTVTLDTSSFTGLKTLNIQASTGADSITAAATTDVTVVDSAVGGLTVSGGLSQTVSGVGEIDLDSAAGAVVVTETGAGLTTNAINVDDGTTVTINAIKQSTGTITVGGNSAPSGAVTINTGIVAGATGGLITVNGGTVVTVNENATNAAGSTVTSESAVTVNGGSATTKVVVSQAAVAAAATAVTGVVGVAGVAAVTAAPGTQPVAAVTAVNAVDAVAAAAGITADGAVTINDVNYNTTKANTITSVTLNNYGAGSVISANAVGSLTLSGTAGTLTLNNATNGAGGVAAGNGSLTLNVSGLSGTNTITDTNAEVTTLNVVTGAAASTLAAFSDANLATLNVSGASTLKLSAINASLTKVAVSGAAGFNDGGTTAANGFAARGGAATITTTSSGSITMSLDSTTQTFVGSTGKDTIRISDLADATKVITGGSGVTDELVLEGGAYALTAATGVKVTGFETLGVAANVTGNIDVSALGSTFNKLHVIGNSTVSFSKVAANTALVLDTASSSVTYGVANATGAADTVSVTLGGATSDTVNFGTIVLKDANAVGIGTVNLVSNGVNITAGDSTANNNTVVLTDNGLSNLNVSGTQGLAITTINEATTQATSFNLNNTNTSSFGVVVGTLTDTNLGGLTFSGTGSSTITTLTDASSTTLAIGNTGTKLAIIDTVTSSAALTSLTLTGNVQIGDGLVGGTGLTSTATTGITVSGATDNAHVKLSLGAAAAGLVNNVTLGNGNDVVTDATIAGTSNVTVGTGSNFLTIGGATTNTTGAFNINLGAHTATGPDFITVGTGGTAYATAANYVITGAAVGDRVIFNTDSAATLVGHTAGVITQVTAGTTLAQTITALETAVDALAAHGIAYTQFGGNTYIVESISSTLGATDTTIVELVGAHTITAGTAGVGGYALITG